MPDDTERFDPKTMVGGALPKQFSTPHGIVGSKDGKIYVADRRGNRIQAFDHAGTFLAEQVIAPATLSSGSAFVPVLSPDAAQQWLYVADGTNHKVWVLRRLDLKIVGEFGRGGRQVGQFLRPHGMSIDTQGNLYVGEATGKRASERACGGPRQAGELAVTLALRSRRVQLRQSRVHPRHRRPAELARLASALPMSEAWAPSFSSSGS